MLELIVGAAIALGIFLLQEWRSKRAQRNLRKGIQEDLQGWLPGVLEATWKAGSRAQAVPEAVRAAFVDFGRQASSSIAFGGTPPAATIVTSFAGDARPRDDDLPGVILVP